MNIKERIAIENRVIKCLVESLVGQGCKRSIFDGEDYPVKKSNDVKLLLKNLYQTEEDRLTVWSEAGEKLGYVYLVYGNDGYDVISDYTSSLGDSGYLSEVIHLCDILERRYG